MQLQKARLVAKDSGIPEIEFMFNPTELLFQKENETSENKGSRTQDKGQPKVNFANTNSYKVTVNKILFDTYETGEDVVKKHIDSFRRAVQFDEKLVAEKKERPPLYTFMWGKHVYLRSCFIEKLSYKLTMFLPDGTPVRATIDSLTLKEADEPKPNNPVGIMQNINDTMRRLDSLQNRLNGKGSTSAAAQTNPQNQSAPTQRK